MTSVSDDNDGVKELYDEIAQMFRVAHAERIVEQLPTLLIEASSKAARRALDAFWMYDGTAEIHAGMAVEYLAKARLARSDPLKIVTSDTDSNTVMSGQGHELCDPEYVTLKNVRTITAKKAVQGVYSEWGDSATGLSEDGVTNLADAVFFTRNAVAHLAVPTSHEDLRSALGAMVTLINWILQMDNEWAGPTDVFWGKSAAFIDLFADPASDLSAVARSVKVEEARCTLECRIPEDLADDHRLRFLATLSNRAKSDVLRPCPACGQSGALQYEEIPGDTLEYVNGRSIEIVRDPIGYHCYVCEFDLEVDELEHFGLHLRPSSRFVEVNEFGDRLED